MPLTYLRLSIFQRPLSLSQQPTELYRHSRHVVLRRATRITTAAALPLPLRLPLQPSVERQPKR